MDILAPRCPFFAMAANLGGMAVSGRHKDMKNLAAGICLIMVFGKFNHAQGGHLVLHEAKVILEVPNAAIVAIPSALLSHENIKILAGETRYVMVLFSSGGIYRYRDHGWMTDKAWEERFGEPPNLDEDIWTQGQERFLTVEELIAYKHTQ